MKLLPKIFLLFIGITIFIITLYFSLPAIPQKIKDEIDGNQYTFKDISFNLISKNLTFPNEETRNMLDTNSGGNLTILTKENGDRILLFYSEEDNSLIEEEIKYLQNPFRHRSLEKIQKESGDKYSEWIQETGISTVSVDIKILKGRDKIIIWNHSGTSDQSYSNSFELKLGDQYYTAIFAGNSWSKEDMAEFVRSVNLNK